jgi:hypothetical protein
MGRAPRDASAARILKLYPLAPIGITHQSDFDVRSRRTSMFRAKGLSLACGAAALAAAGIVFSGITLPTAANAKPEFAAKTGQACGACHVSPSGGGKLTAKGEKFKANGFK